MSDEPLMFFLNNQGKDFGNWRQRMKHQDLGLSLYIRIIKTHKKLHSMLLLLKIHPSFHCSTSVNWNKLKILMFIPKYLETSEIGIDVHGTLATRCL